MTQFNLIFEDTKLKAVKDGDDVWFRVDEICAELGHTNPRKALSDHVDTEDVTKRDTLTAGGVQQVNYVNESGFYSLIYGVYTTAEFAKKVAFEDGFAIGFMRDLSQQLDERLKDRPDNQIKRAFTKLLGG